MQYMGVEGRIEMEGSNSVNLDDRAYSFYGTAEIDSGSHLKEYHGLYLNTPTNNGTILNKYGVSQVDANSKNYFAGNVGIGTTTPLAKLDIQGTQGQLFSVTDNLSGSIFAVADISGVPIFDVNSSGVSYFDSKVYINATASIPNRTEEFQVTGTQIITNTGTNSPALYLGYNSSGSNSVQLGRGRTADGSSYIDLNGEVMAAGDYGFRIMRNAGVNAVTMLNQVGTGNLQINAANGADTVFTNTNVGIRTTSVQSNTSLDVRGNGSASDAAIKAYAYGESGTSILGNGYATSGSGINYGVRGISTGPRSTVAGSVNVGGYFSASNAETNYALITGTGNVGIGTTSPNQKLHVNGATQLGDINPTVNFGTVALKVVEGTVSTGPTLGSGTVGAQAVLYSNGQFGMYTGVNGTTGNTWMQSQRNDTGTAAYNILLNPIGGKVGIGTDSPGAKLEVVDGGLAAYIYSSQNTGLRVRGGGNSTDIAQFQNVGGSTVAVLDSSGNVGIGVTTTSYKLEVDGLSKISGNVIIGTDPSTYANLTLKDATTTGSSSKSLFIISQNSGRSFLSLVTAGTGEAQIGFGTSQYASQNTAGSIQYTTATHKFTFKTNYTLALTIANNQAATFTSTVTATNFILSSDKTLKNNIKEIDTNHIDVNWKNFELKSEPGVKRSGVIAQELEEAHPEFVRTDEQGMKSVAYIDLLIAKIAELEARLEKAGI